MATAAVAQLKSTLSRCLARVKAGEELIVTERRKPIARIIPMGHSSPSRGQSDLDDLERAGLIHRGTGRLPRGFWRKARMKDPKGQVLSALLQERREGR
jgi:antitoxin (DNA-binding transcriptional repressor) of toxin-antitoxin stability system